MLSARPELLIVAGPGKGARAVLMTDSVSVGRSAACDVRVPEQSVSRHQLTFTADPEGWLVENVSKQAIRINDRKYKSGGKAYLETGDALYLGTASVLLFVSAGDDPDQASRAFLAEHPELADVQSTPIPAQTAAATPASPAPASAPPPVTAAPIPAAPATEPPTEPPPLVEDGEEDSAAQQEQDILAERRKKLIKYGIGAGVYVVILIILFAVLSTLSKDDDDKNTGGAPGWYGDDEIRVMLTQEYELRRNASLAGEYLQVARQMYRDRTLNPGNLFRCVKHYKLYLAYRAGERFEGPTQDERQYRDALRDLTDRIIGTYRSAYANSRNKNWAAARREFMELLAMLPAGEDPQTPPFVQPPSEDPEKKFLNTTDLIQNIRAHIGYVNRAERAAKRR